MTLGTTVPRPQYFPFSSRVPFIPSTEKGKVIHTGGSTGRRQNITQEGTVRLESRLIQFEGDSQLGVGRSALTEGTPLLVTNPYTDPPGPHKGFLPNGK